MENFCNHSDEPLGSKQQKIPWQVEQQLLKKYPVPLFSPLSPTGPLGKSSSTYKSIHSFIQLPINTQASDPRNPDGHFN
jgi:hypothetical protein